MEGGRLSKNKKGWMGGVRMYVLMCRKKGLRAVHYVLRIIITFLLFFYCIGKGVRDYEEEKRGKDRIVSLEICLVFKCSYVST